MSFEVDHIVALVNGGEDVLENKQAAHRKCNRDQWDRLDEAGAPRAFVTTRNW
jgi:5-methylcytosine-specific restriction endonuclease McrA